MASNFGELVLVLGDHHLPSRAVSIPEPFRRMLVPNKMQHVVCTGNIGCVEEYNRLRDLVGGTAASNVHCVAGEFDLQSSDVPATPSGSNEPLSGVMPSFPETKVIQLGSFRVGIIGGHQVAPCGDLRALSMVKKRLGVDVLVCGWRRKNGVVEFDGGYYIFPGSITGAYSAHTSEVNPSFILLAVQGDKVVCYVYELVNGEVDVSKTEFSRQ